MFSLALGFRWQHNRNFVSRKWKEFKSHQWEIQLSTIIDNNLMRKIRLEQLVILAMLLIATMFVLYFSLRYHLTIGHLYLRKVNDKFKLKCSNHLKRYIGESLSLFSGTTYLQLILIALRVDIRQESICVDSRWLTRAEGRGRGTYVTVTTRRDVSSRSVCLGLDISSPSLRV